MKIPHVLANKAGVEWVLASDIRWKLSIRAANMATTAPEAQRGGSELFARHLGALFVLGRGAPKLRDLSEPGVGGAMIVDPKGPIAPGRAASATEHECMAPHRLVCGGPEEANEGAPRAGVRADAQAQAPIESRWQSRSR